MKAKVEYTGNEVEEIFCIPFSQLTQQPMDEDLSEILISLILRKEKFEMKKEDKPFLFQVIEKRIHAYNFTIKGHDLIMFLCAISESPGTAVMYLTYLSWYAHKHGITEYTLAEFCNVFPMGYPSKHDLQKMWDSQKYEGGNMLDNGELMTSFNIKKQIQS